MSPSVLIADDEVDLAVTCARYFEQLGYRCLMAYDAGRAIELLVREEPDVVITDLQLPGKNGLEITKHIRQTRPRLPVIVISAYDRPEVADAAYEAGASLYLPKPFSLSELAKFTNSALNGRLTRRPSANLSRNH